MRVKIGDRWYGATAESPIMVELSSNDKANISQMSPKSDRYAIFAGRDQRTVEERSAWMDEGAFNPGNGAIKRV